MSISPAPFQLVCALALAAVAAISDLRTGRIPNLLNALGLGVGVVSACVLAWLEHGAAALYLGPLFSLGGLLCCTPYPVLLYVTRSIGGGDVKLLMALGALLGPWLGLQAQLYACSFGALYGIGVLIYRGQLLATLRALLSRPFSRARPVAPAPHELTLKLGPVICLAVLLTLSLHWSAS